VEGGPALAAGCTVVLKPAHETPLTALLLGEIAVAAGLPAGALNVVPGPGSTAGAALVRHPLVDKIAFTGSTEVGQWIMREAAATVKRVTLELGGKSPNIIFADADLPAAVRGAQNGIFYGKGEVCAAGSRLLVEQAVHDQVVEQVAERAKSSRPAIRSTRTPDWRDRVAAAAADGVVLHRGGREGRRPAGAGGKPAKVNGKGYYVEATVFDGAKPGMKIVDEEIFGPVLSVLTFANEAEGIELANRSMYGLAAGIWTKDVQKAHRVARAIKAGTSGSTPTTSMIPPRPSEATSSPGSAGISGERRWTTTPRRRRCGSVCDRSLHLRRAANARREARRVARKRARG